MYDELVKRLRKRAEAFDYDGWVETASDYEKAADAIEKLSKPKWIPVTERLPEERINPYTTDFEYVLCSTIWGDVRPFKYGTQIGQKEAHFWNGAGYVDAYITHWMPLPEPPKEEKKTDG